MRNLTVRRRKVFTGCLNKTKLYIEDPLNQEITIDKTPCRKLGVLKNGDVQTFRIDDEARKIYVIADKITKGYCNEFYQLPAGSEDLVLTGQVQMEVGTGMFRFDDNNSEGIQSKRKKGAVIGVIVLIVACVLGFFGGKYITGQLLKSKAAEPKTFTSHGMTITLTKDFTEDSAVGYTSFFRSKDVAVLTVREPFALLDGLEDYTVEEYGALALEGNGMSASLLKTFNGIPGFEYDAEHDGDTYHYRIFLFKADDAFWMVEFTSFKDQFSRYESQIGKWAGSVTFG